MEDIVVILVLQNEKCIMFKIYLFFLFVFSTFGMSQTGANGLQILPLPSKAQLVWQDQSFYLFVHFGTNTFSNKEWGLGDEPESVFNPTALDCNQWARIAKAVGAKGIILMARHHDGFCLWPVNSVHIRWPKVNGKMVGEMF